MNNRTRIYDNGGETIDRYTLVMPGEKGHVEMWGFNEHPFHPQGFGQYCGDYEVMRSYKHLGKIVDVTTLPKMARKYVYQIIKG
jgi:hypothetical protein